MNGRTPTRIERDWLIKCQQIPCLACSIFHGVHDSPSEIHHLDGQQKPNAHLKSISLCTRHHRVSDNANPKRWISRHGDGRSLFEARYMVESAFLEHQKLRVQALEQNTI